MEEIKYGPINLKFGKPYTSKTKHKLISFTALYSTITGLHPTVRSFMIILHMIKWV
jgi:hypothetical protein